MDPAAPHLMDEILEEIFLRLPTPAALARTSMASVSFRSIITERFFLRRYRKLHPPPLLGFVHPGGHRFPLASPTLGCVDPRGFHPAQAPHPSAPLARAVADGADFTYSFVPEPRDRKGRRPRYRKGWKPSDIRDGRVLLESIESLDRFPILAVCDPLSRRYLLLPHIPTGLAVQGKDPHENVPILAPISDEDEDETSFKVICVSRFDTKLVAIVFSSVTQQWCIAASLSYPFDEYGVPSYLTGFSCLFCVRGCFYFAPAAPCLDALFVLDTQRMEFSTVVDRTGYHIQLRCMPCQEDDPLDYTVRNRPGESRSIPFCIVEGREGALEMFSLPNNGQPSNEWQLENIIPLPGQYDYYSLGAAEGFFFLGATTEDQLDMDNHCFAELSGTEWDVDYFSLEVQTSKLTKVCRRRSQFFNWEHVYWYFGFPPSLSKPSI
ncbi:hypothetical protein BRADI_3g03192v3 [Brachypodium distachyon]|uniref:F-box domain-containing protein n=1 Tax=Brachypodium distachyon TaxID=15368 RepID=A0A2K2CUX2_BRADI|nr:hypothetical protein BRADI_3g03192v3 [Brachypodium distachyon]